MQIAERMDNVPFSGIRKILESVNQLELKGEKIIRLEIGRPDFDTPDNIKIAAANALSEGKVHYSSNYGIPVPTWPELFPYQCLYILTMVLFPGLKI